MNTEQLQEGREFNLNGLEELSILLNGELTHDNLKQMVDLTQKAKENSYSPYSKFRVGCCLLTDDGQYILGTNVENISYGMTICAERSAICSAVSNGSRNFKAALVTTDMDYFVSPCGACRQVLAEFNVKYCFLMTKDNNVQYYTMKHLLPLGCEIPHLNK